MPKRSGNWRTICTRMNRLAGTGVLELVFTQFHRQQIVCIKLGTVALDSTIVTVHSGSVDAQIAACKAQAAVDGAAGLITMASSEDHG